MARIESRPPYDASFPQAGSGEFSRIAQAAKKRSEAKEQKQAQAQERAYAVTEPTPKEEAVEVTPIEEPTLKEPIAKPKVKPMPFPRVSFQEDAPRAEKEQKPKAKPMSFPRYGFQEDAPWAVNGISPKAPAIPAAPQKKAEKPSAASKEETTDIGADLDPHIVAGHRVSFQEDAPWAKDNPYAFGLEQSTRNQAKFAGKPISELEKDAVYVSNRTGITGKDYLMEKEIKRRKNKLRDFEFIANTPGALASYGIALTEDKWKRIKGEILSGTDSLKDLTPLLQKAKRVKYEEGKEKQRTISQVSDRAYQLEREMERAGATKAADKAMKSDATMAMMLPSPTSAQIWKTTSYNDKLPDTYRAAMQLQEHANELSQLNKSFLSNLEKGKNWAGGVWEGFKNNILTRKAWQDKEGNTYAANEMALYRVIQAYNNGDNSPEVKKVVEMAAELNSAEAFMRSLLPKGYEAGESTAGSIPFMIDFIVTSALTGGAGGAEKAASKVGASGVKALATRGILTASGKGTRFLELLARYGQKAAQGVKGVATAVAEKAPGVTRMGGRIVKDATQAAIMTATLNAPSVASDAERRVTPIPYKLEGDLSDISDFIPINDDHILMEKRFMERNRSKALRKAFTSQWIENYSELAGGHFDTYLKALGKLTNFSGTAAGKAIARLNNALSKAPIVGSVRRAANIQGLGGEFAEEIYGGMLDAWLVGDQSMKEVFDAKNMGTTLEALLPTQIAFGILGGGSHALSLAGNQRQLAKINKQLKEEFGDTDDGGKRWEKLTLSEQGKVLDGLTGVYRDAMQRSNEAKDDATRQKAVKEATYARLLFMRLGLQTRRSVLQGAEAEAKLEQTQEKFNTLKQEAENALKAEANRTTTDRAGNSVTVRYNDKEYSVYNTEGVTIGQDEKGEPRVLGKGTLYLRAPETDGGSTEIIPVPSDQVEVVAVQPKEEVDAAIEQSTETVAEAAIQPELAAQEAESAPMAQEAESIPTAQEAETKIAPIPTAQEGETKIAPIPTAQEGKTKMAPIPTAQVSKQSAPMAQEAESAPMAESSEETQIAQAEAQYLSPEEAANLSPEQRTEAIDNFNNSLRETDTAIEKLAKEQREYLRKRNTRKRAEETEEEYQTRKAEARKETAGDLQRVNTEMALLQNKKENLLRSLTALHAEEQMVEEDASEADYSAINDLNENSPAAYRARGFKLIGGKRVPRQGRVKCYVGRAISAQVSHTEETEGGHYAVIEADDLQPSHFDAAVNERHFIPEAQPKDRATTASFEQQEDFGRGLRVPNLIFSEASIYSGAPVVNSRGEVIQGNGRSAGIKSAYRSHPESSGRYKAFLTEHASDWGLKREDVASMKAPVLVHMLDVDDEEAIRLGQFTDNDVTVTGGTENVKNLLPENVILKLPVEKQGEVARILFASDEADGDKIPDERYSAAFLYLHKNSAISLEEYNALFTANSAGALVDSARKPLEAAKRELITRLLGSVFHKVDPKLRDIVFGRKSVQGIKTEQLNAIKRLLLTDFFFATSTHQQTRERNLRNDILGALLFISKYPSAGDRIVTAGMDPLRTFLRNLFSAAPVIAGMKSLAESFSPEALELANLFYKSPEAINAFTRKYYSETNPQMLFEQSEETQSLSKEELFRQVFPFYQEAHRIAYARREAAFDEPLTEHYARKQSAERGEDGYRKTDFGYERGNKTDGQYEAIDKNGNYIEQSEWRDGVRHGVSTLYYSNGNAKAEGRFFKGARAGAFTEYNNRGQLIRHFTFPRDGRSTTGVYTDFYQNESHSVEACIKTNGVYRDGVRDGVWKHYDKEGNLILTETYSHGALQGSYTKLQPIKDGFGSQVHAEYANGHPEGRYVEMQDGSEVIKFNGSIVNGKFIGKRGGSGHLDLGESTPYVLGEPIHTTFDISTDAFEQGEQEEVVPISTVKDINPTIEAKTPKAEGAEPTAEMEAKSAPMTQSSEATQVAPKEEAAQTGTDHLLTGERTKSVGNAPVVMQNREGNRITLTDASGNSLTVRLSDEKDRNGKPYVLTSDGKLSYGVVPGGLVPEEPKTKEVRLSLGSDVEMKGTYRYGLVHIMKDHYAQLKELGFETVEEFIKHVLSNIGGAVLDKIYEGKTTHFVFTMPFPSKSHPSREKTDILIVEMSDGSNHWDIINSWRAENRYIEKKKKEAEAAVPAIGLPHATNVAEGYQNGTTESSNSAVGAGTQNLPLSDDKDTKKTEPSDVPLEKGTNDAEAAPTDEAFRIGNEPSGKRVSERTWHKLVDRLGKSGLATEFVTDSKAFSEKLNSLRRSERELIGGKTVFGFVDKRTGSVYLNPETMDANTPLHECAHLWNALIRTANPELWARGRYLIEQSPYAFEVRNEESYSGLSAEERADEALARAIADRGEKILKQSGMRGLSLRAWIRDVWQHILAFFGIKPKANTLNDITDMALGDLLNGQAERYEIPKEEEASQILFRIGNKRRAEYRDRLHKKRTDLSDVAIEKTLDAIEAFGEEEAGDKGDSKLETLALHWTLLGSIDLTREADAKNLDDIPDSTLVRQAAEAARRKKVDPMQYESPSTLLDDIAEGMTFGNRLDPDKEPCFTARHEVPGTDIVVYDVANSKKGQRAVRAFVDSHWGVNANPWCLITRNADAWHYWNHYNYKQKQIAFQNGKLLAFKACDEVGSETPWWNRQDNSSPGVPGRKDLGGGKYLPLVVDEVTGEPIGETQKYALRGERGGNLYEEWTPDGEHILLRETHEGPYKKTFERWTEDGVLVERNKQDRGHLEAKQWYPSGKRKYLSIDTGRGHVSSYWHENGNREEFRLSRNGNMYIASWDEDGQRLSLYTKDAQGNSRRETWNTNGQRSLLEIKDKKGNKHVEQWYIDGQRQSITTKNENGYEQEEKWDRDGTYSLYKTDEEGARREEKRYANGQCSFLEIINKDESSSSETWYENGQRQTRRIIYNGGDSKETWYENGQRKSIETTDKEGNIRKEQWYEDGKRKLIEAKDKKGNERKEQWYEDGGYLLYIADETGKARQDIWFPNGQKKNLLIFNSISEQKFSEWYESGKRKLFHISRDGNSRGAYWYENRQREWVYAKDNAGNKRDERWYENGKRKYIEIEDADKKLYWNISFEESGNVISAECKINRGVINFNWENGVRIDDSISQELNAEEALQKIAEEFEKLTGEPLHFPDNTDVQYRKGAQEKEAIDNPQSAADEVAQHDAYRRALTTQYGETARDTETDKARKQQVAEDALRKLGLEGIPVEVVSRGDVAEAYARDAMGWHDRKTGRVTIVAENNELEDIEATVLHEVVGHHGLETLLGKEGLATLTNEVLPLIPEAERQRLEATYGTDEQTIAEEYIAGMAEQYTPPSVWARIAGFIRNALRRIGFRLPLTDGDLLYLTWRGIRATRKEQSSTDTLLHRADEKRVIARCQELDDIQFRKPRKQILSELAADGVDEKGVLKLTEAMNELLEKRVYKLRETWQNDTQSFIELARCVEAATGETIPDEMNIDKVYNQSASKAFARQEETRKKYDRMMQAVRYFARKAQLSPELTELYFLAKHAPERNAEMRRRAEELFDPTTRTEEQEDILNNYYTNLFPGWNKQNGDAYASEAEAREAFLGALKDALTTKDYAAEEAITERIATLIKQDKKSPYKAITDEGNLLNAFTEAVEARAGHQDVYHVWQLVNGFNRGTIELWRSSGMIDEATYQKVTGMFAHYVPMQGWKENTNQTPWEYNIRAHIDTNPLKTMHGRQSLPGSPFEAMLKSAMNSIVAATRNEERQALYFFAQRYGSDYLSASSAWYVLRQEGDTKRWVEAYPETVTRKTEKGDAIESTTQETAEAFFARMKELEAKGLARQRTQSTRPETGYLLSERQEKEHIIPLFFDGQKYNVFVNGNPRFSRAATRHNRASDANGAADKLLRSVRWFTREMGQNITGRSLSFGAANMVRDLLFAEMSSSTIYGTRYALAFNRAYFTDVIPLMLGLKKGDTARLYNEYKANGGRTGFAFLTGDKRSARSTRNALSNSLTARAGRAGRSFWNAYMGINEHLEDMSRFAAYAAARKMGLGITEATHRAKSITVNFNKRGTGNSPMYQFLSTLYLFFNANLQGVALTGKMFRDHPKRAAAWSIGLILLQPLMTLLYTALANPDGDDGDDEDETLQEKYDRLPLKDVNPFLRRSNICIPLGEGKLIKVPLSPEMRALNGIGVTLSDMLMGRATSGDLALATIDGALNSSSIGLDASISSFADANELAERGENGALYTALRGAVPSALQPFGDIAANRDWSGRRIYGESVYHRGTPSYLYADKSTPRWMTNAAAGWNTMLYGQGDKHIGEVSTGLLSVNPSSVNYLAERYLGGILEFVTDINRATDMLTDKNEGSVSQALGQAPVTRRFWKDDPLMQGSEARRNFYSTRRALRQDIERIDRMKRNAKNADYKEANEIRNSIRTYLDGRNEMQLRYLAKRFDALSDTMKAHDEAYAGKDTETRLSVRERDTRAIERLLKEAERLEAVTK